MSAVDLTADVTGTVWKVHLKPGDAVAADDAILVIESMKMEIPLAAPAAGRVVEILVAEGEAVEEDQVLARFEPD
jgi:biotin carboxyl carrier protein